MKLNNTFEVTASYVNGDIGNWEVVPKEETGLIFDGAITAFERTADQTLKIQAVNHGLEVGDEVQIIDATDYNRTCGVEKIDDQNFVVNGIRWQPGEAVNLKLESRKRRGIIFEENDDYITIPGALKPAATGIAYEYTYSAWVYVPTGNPGERLLVGQTEQLAQIYLKSNGKVALKVNLNSQEIEDLNAIVNNQWVHYAGFVSCDKDTSEMTLKLCKNGEEVASTVVTDPQISDISEISDQD